MSINGYKNIWVFIESANGKVRNVSLELLSAGKNLANANNEKLVGIVIGKNLDDVVKTVIAYGVDEVILVEGDEYQNYSTDGYTNAMVRLVEKYSPSVILIGATNNGRDLAPRVAGRLNIGMISDCTGFEIKDDTGDIVWTKPLYGGNLISNVLCSTRPQLATVRNGSFKKEQPDNTRTANVIKEEIKTSEDDIRTKVIDFIKAEETGNIKLEEAEVIVSGGRGLGKPENFAIIKELADVLGGAVGASRAAVDAGWISPFHQVGQTGKTVAPEVYIACGISGAIQHLAGMSSSKVIVAINKDPDAPIFDVADYAVVGDLFEVVPVLTEEIRKIKKS